MITKYATKNVSETLNLNNPTQGTQCGDKQTPPKKTASRRDATFTLSSQE